VSNTVISSDEEDAVDTVLEALLAETMVDVKSAVNAVNKEAHALRGSQHNTTDDDTGNMNLIPRLHKKDDEAAQARTNHENGDAAAQAQDELDQILKALPAALLPSVNCLERLSGARIDHLEGFVAAASLPQ
jgi:hypothetical protein